MADKLPFSGAIVLTEEEFDAAVRVMSEPQEPTEAAKRGAEMIRELYGDVCPHCYGHGRVGVMACWHCGATGRMHAHVGSAREGS